MAATLEPDCPICHLVADRTVWFSRDDIAVNSGIYFKEAATSYVFFKIMPRITWTVMITNYDQTVSKQRHF